MQVITPDWVRARVLAMFLLVFQGSVAAGSALWGAVAQRIGIQGSLQWAGLGALASVALALRFKLPSTASDMSPWVHWRAPAVFSGTTEAVNNSPVLVTIEYKVRSGRQRDFEMFMQHYSRIRRRDGASRWEIFRDVESDDQYFEVFLVASWAEHLRQHERQTLADQELEKKVLQCVQGDPRVRHLIYADAATDRR
jgi:hypothetical protein